MKLAIISDVHDNISNLKIVLDFLRERKINHLICAGDLASRETFEFLKQNCRGKFYYVFGNAEKDHTFTSEVKGDNEEFLINNLKIAINHFPGRAKKLAQTGKYDLVFYGHTHRPWEEKIDNTRLINPGNVAGLYYEPTFAVYDTENGKLELIHLRQLDSPSVIARSPKGDAAI